MARPKCIILHPRDWMTGGYKGEYDYVHVSIGGKVPRKKNKTPTFDGYADMVTPEGVQDLCTAFEKHRPDMFLFWLHGGFGGSLLARLKKICPRTKMLMWFGNHRPKVAGNVMQIRRWLDMLFLNSTDPRQYAVYRKAGIAWVGTLWDGYNPSDVKLAEVKPKYDCVFGGNTYLPLVKSHHKGHKLDFPGGKIRYDFISRLAKEFKMLVRSGYKTWPKHVTVLPELFHPHYHKFLRDGKVNVNVNHFPTFRQAYTRRTIRSIFSGRLHITLHIPGMDKHFTNHKNIVWFHNIEEGMDLVRYYIEHDNEREEIAAEAYRHACKHFTFEQRQKDFERMTRVLLPSKKGKK